MAKRHVKFTDDPSATPDESTSCPTADRRAVRKGSALGFRAQALERSLSANHRSRKSDLDRKSDDGALSSNSSVDTAVPAAGHSTTAVGYKHHHACDEAAEELWIGPFIDIIYVATIFNLSHLVSECGERVEVYILLAAYFAIMFMTRYSIDVLAISFLKNDLINRLVHGTYSVGVFVMTLNIAQDTGHQGDSSYSNDDHTTDDHAATDDHADDDHRRRFLSGGSAQETQSFHPTAYPDEVGNCTMNYNYSFGFAAAYLYTRMFLIAMYCLVVMHNRKRGRFHLLWEQYAKITAFALGSAVMFFAFGRYSPLIIFPIAAGVEFIALALPETLFQFSVLADAKELQARLGLFFMLVLGESMIGLLITPYALQSTEQSLTITLFSFLAVFSIGMQFFDAALVSTESPRKEINHLDECEHALVNDSLLCRQLFIWMFPIVGFGMLIATTGFTDLYAIMADSSNASSSLLFSDKVKISVGLFVITIGMIVMRGLHKAAGLWQYLQHERLRITYKVIFAVLHLMVFLFPVSSFVTVVFHAAFGICMNALEILFILFELEEDDIVASQVRSGSTYQMPNVQSQGRKGKPVHLDMNMFDDLESLRATSPTARDATVAATVATAATGYHWSSNDADSDDDGSDQWIASSPAAATTVAKDDIAVVSAEVNHETSLRNDSSSSSFEGHYTYGLQNEDEGLASMNNPLKSSKAR